MISYSEDRFNSPKSFFGLFKSKLIKSFLLFSQESFVIVFRVVLTVLIVMLLFRKFSTFFSIFDGFCKCTYKVQRNTQRMAKFGHFSGVMNKNTAAS